jgi:peptidoglycan/LPS O-acetylase OafA/YrhL
MVFVASILVFTSAIHYAVPPSDVYLFFWTNPVVLEFTLGIVAAHLYLSGLQPSRLTTFLLIAVGATLLVVVPQNAEARPLTWGLPAFALVYGLLSAEQHIPFHRVRSLMVIGDSSYSIYLVHTLVIPALAALALHVRNWPPYELAVPLLLIVCGATLIGCVTYRLIERPLTQVLQKAWRRYQARSNTTQVAPHAIISSGFYVEPQRDLKRPV